VIGDWNEIRNTSLSCFVLPESESLLSSIMSKNRPHRGSSYPPRPNRDNNQRRGPNSVPAGAGSPDGRSRNKFENIPSISRSSGMERDGDTYVHMRLVCWSSLV